MKRSFPICDINLYEFSFSSVDSRMYVLSCGVEMIIVDPVKSDEAIVLVRELKPKTIDIILTHEHFDHISGVNDLKSNFDCRVICTENCAKCIIDPKKNLSQYYNILIQTHKGKNALLTDEDFVKPYSCKADLTFHNSYSMSFMNHDIRLVHTPGHSKGSLCMILGDKCLFTGDSLLADVPIVTKLPGGSRKEYEKLTLPFLKSFDGNTFVLPGHGRSTVISEMMLI